MLNRCLALVFALCFATGCEASTQRLCVREACYAVDLADTDASRQQGLMFLDALPAGKGMFFVFNDENTYAFWMKNMKFPIDILWADAGKRVVHIASDVPACTAEPCPVYTPSAKAQYVLEIPAGDAAKYGIRIGDRIQ